VPSTWKAEFDLTMEQIFKDIAETSRVMDGIEEMRHEQGAAWSRPRHLHLVPPIEEADDGQR
jgi:hypothetical protein